MPDLFDEDELTDVVKAVYTAVREATTPSDGTYKEERAAQMLGACNIVAAMYGGTTPASI
jgi:hypothetical protein